MNKRCKEHGKEGCKAVVCVAARRRAASSSTQPSTYDDLANPVSPLHQAVYGGTYYGADGNDYTGTCAGE